MISKLRFSLVAVILLVLLGFGFQNQAKGQPGLNDQFCPDIPYTNGWLETDVLSSNANFSGALIGTVEAFGGATVGGLDWQHIEGVGEDFFIFNPTPTNEIGSQLVSWWTQKNGRNTFLQVTSDWFVDVHVRIYDENCVEIRNFCDFYTPGDTHVYNFGDLVDNEGDDINEGILQDREGFVVVTAVTDGCPGSDMAIEFYGLAGNMFMLDSSDYLYGVNTYARQGVCLDEFVDVNLILNGSFQDLSAVWDLVQGNATIVTPTSISPNVAVPPCNDPSNPDCDDPDADLYMALVASDDSPGFADGYYGQNTMSEPTASLMNNDLINTGVVESNVSVLQSNSFTPDGGNVVVYESSILNPNDFNFDCDNYTAVCVVDISDPMNPFFEECDCYNRNGVGSLAGSNCLEIGDDDTVYSVPPLEFQGGRSGFFTSGLGVNSGSTYVVQVITGQKTDNGCLNTGFPRGTNGALVDNFRVIEEQVIPCEFPYILDGSDNAFLVDIQPDQFAAQFNVQDTIAGSDVVMINFRDEYEPAYRPLAANTTSFIQIWDDTETPQSCGEITGCFIRLGVDENIVISEEFEAVSPSPSIPPSPTPSVPSSPSPIPSPTPSNKGGSSSGCAIAGSPIQLGTAMANVLIPLVPVAFAFGIGVVRRRKK